MTIHEEYDALVRGKSPVLATIATAAHWAARTMRQAVAAAERRYLTHRLVRILSGLDDHILADIGVERGSIFLAAREIEARKGRAAN